MSIANPGANLPLVPWPQSVLLKEGWLSVDTSHVQIVSEPELQCAQEWLGSELTQLAAQYPAGGDATGIVVELVLAPPPEGVPFAQGIDASGIPHDERHSIEIGAGRVVIAGPGPRAVLRGVATFLQLLAVPEPRLPICRIDDGPRFAWRGLSLDVARYPFTIGEIGQVVDLIARYKFNVLHLHLTDSQSWRITSNAHPKLIEVSDGSPITIHDLENLAEHAASRGITIVPEVDFPGHSAAAIRAYPDLAADAQANRLGYLDPSAPAAREFIEAEAAAMADNSPAAFVHVGGDEAFGMPADAYAEAVQLAAGAVHRAGKRVVACQEAVRTDALEQTDVVQVWIGAETNIDVEGKKADLPPEAHHFVDEMVKLFAKAPGDLPLLARLGAPALISSNDVLYLDRPYAEPAATHQGEQRRARVGFTDYPAKTLQQMHEWMPEDFVAGHGVPIAGVEAAIWAETIESFDDLAFLLLPRLGSVAERAWLVTSTSWEDYSVRLAPHRAVWESTGWGAAYELRGESEQFIRTEIEAAKITGSRSTSDTRGVT